MNYNKVRKELCIIFILAILFSIISGTVVNLDAINMESSIEHMQDFVLLAPITGKIAMTSFFENHFLLVVLLGTVSLQFFLTTLIIVISEWKRKNNLWLGAIARAGTLNFRYCYQLE